MTHCPIIEEHPAGEYDNRAYDRIDTPHHRGKETEAMPSLPSHQDLCFEKDTSSPCLLIDPCESDRFFQPYHDSFQTDLASVRSISSHQQLHNSLILAYLIRSRGAIDQTIHPRAQQGGILWHPPRNGCGELLCWDLQSEARQSCGPLALCLRPQQSTCRLMWWPTTSTLSLRQTEICTPGMLWSACKPKGLWLPQKTGKRGIPCPCLPNS